MKDSRKRILAIFFVLVTWGIGPLCYAVYSALTQSVDGFGFTLFEERSNVAIVLSTFAFTMLGFLAAIITIVFSYAGTDTVRRYKRLGYMDVFFVNYYSTIVGLITTFVLAILCFSERAAPTVFPYSLMSMTNNLVQIALITITIVNLARRASSETAQV